jgi:hypothetical protein
MGQAEPNSEVWCNVGKYRPDLYKEMIDHQRDHQPDSPPRHRFAIGEKEEIEQHQEPKNGVGAKNLY